MIIQIGIDEAGRGCAIGPLKMAAVAVYPGQEGLLQNWGVRDSKELEPFTIEMLNSRIKGHFSHTYYSIPAASVDQWVEQGKLNEGCRMAAGQLILEMVELHQVNPLVKIEVYLDGHNVFDRIQTQINLLSRTDQVWENIDWSRIDLIIEDHADSKHLCVSAASILAKRERDKHISTIMNNGLGIPKGSGYCNEHTMAWIQRELVTRRLNGRSDRENLRDMQVRTSFKWTKEFLEAYGI